MAETWVINKEPRLGAHTFYFNFQSGGEVFNRITITSGTIDFYGANQLDVAVYDVNTPYRDGWYSGTKYRTITPLESLPSDAIEWFQHNAVNVGTLAIDDLTGYRWRGNNNISLGNFFERFLLDYSVGDETIIFRLQDFNSALAVLGVPYTANNWGDFFSISKSILPSLGVEVTDDTIDILEPTLSNDITAKYNELWGDAYEGVSLFYRIGLSLERSLVGFVYECTILSELPSSQGVIAVEADDVKLNLTFSAFVMLMFAIIYNYGEVTLSIDTAAYANGWNENIREFVITGGEDATNGKAIKWLQDKGTLTAPSGKTLTVTYNGVDIIDSAEVSGDVAVTYDNRTIVTVSDGTKTLKCNGKVMKSDVALGGKTLKCSGKRMVSDVVVKVEGGPEPSGYSVNAPSFDDAIGRSYYYSLDDGQTWQVFTVGDQQRGVLTGVTQIKFKAVPLESGTFYPSISSRTLGFSIQSINPRQTEISDNFILDKDIIDVVYSGEYD